MNSDDMDALIEKAEHKAGTWGMVESAIVMEMSKCIRQLRDEVRVMRLIIDPPEPTQYLVDSFKEHK